MTNRLRYFLLLALAAVVVVGLGAWSQHNLGNKQARNTPVKTDVATVLSPPRRLSPFVLTGDDGKPFTNKNLLGQWTMVFFGFTNCPDLCPTTLSTIKDAYKQFASLKPEQKPKVLFISVDPEQDTPKIIRQYLNSFNKEFIGATGSSEQLKKLTQEMSVVYMKVMQKNNKKKDHYMIDHSGTILVVDPKGQLYAIFTTPHNPDMLAKDMLRIEKNYRSVA